jgi:hypothetical protein
MTGFNRIGVVFAATLACAASLSAQSAKDAEKEKAMMEAWQKAATPTESHKRLEAMVGTFDAKVRSTIDPSQPAQESVATSVNSWVLGGRYVEQQFEGEFMGEPWRGIGYTGYDNIQKKFVSVWMDTAGTGMMFLTSAPDKSGKTISGSARIWDPLSEKPLPVESKIVITDADHHSFELWGKAPNGALMKLMEIQYTRKK